MKRERMRNNRGFTLIELLVVMAISMFVLVAASKVMISMTTEFKQQTRISGKAIQSGFGLEFIRKDISSAGFGLPSGVFEGTANYSGLNWSMLSDEYTELKPSVMPGSLYDNDLAPPRMIDARYPVAPYTNGYALNGSSYLIIRSTAVGTDPVAGKFYVLKNISGVKFVNSVWSLGYEKGADPYRDPDINDSDMVIVLTTQDANNLGLVTDPQDVKAGSPSFDTSPGTIANFRPRRDVVSMVYGISSRSTELNAPFNRVDYYVGNTDVPEKCAPNTGVLYRAEMLHSATGATLDTPVKIMDCVAKMRVEFAVDDNNDGVPETTFDTLAAKTAGYIRKNLKRVDVYILTHEGQFDPAFEYLDNTGAIGNIAVGTMGQEFDAKNIVGDNLVNEVPYWKHFRWRVYKLSEMPVGRGSF